MPRLSLDPATFDTSATALRDAASALHGAGSLGLPVGASGAATVEAALADLSRAWAADVASVRVHLEALATALATASETYAGAEVDVARSLAHLLGARR